MPDTMPPGGRGAPGGNTPPGGREPPGGDAPPLGRPPRLSIGRQGSRRILPRLPSSPVGKAGQKVTVKTTVTTKKAMRDKVADYFATRPDIKKPADQDAVERGFPHEVRGMGYKRKAPKPKKSAMKPGEFTQYQNDPQASAKNADMLNRERERSENGMADLVEIEEQERQSLGPAPAYGFTPDPGGPLDSKEKEEEYQRRYDAYVEDYAARARALHDPDRPIFGQKPPKEDQETASAYDDRYKEEVRAYLKRRAARLGSPGRQT